MAELIIDTDDGPARAFAFGTGPSVLMYIDGLGMRPAMLAIAERLAANGYHVLVPDAFWRMGAYTAPDATTLFGDPAARAAWWQRVTAALDPTRLMRDSRAYLAALPGPVGIVGYCMGGRMAIAAAGAFPDRVVAAAAYHPGNVVTDAPDSAHLQVPHIRGQIYVGAASDDPTFPVDQQTRLTDALTAAGVRHQLEVYPAKHGWVPSDTPVHDAAAAERHWETLLALFAATLR